MIFGHIVHIVEYIIHNRKCAIFAEVLHRVSVINNIFSFSSDFWSNFWQIFGLRFSGDGGQIPRLADLTVQCTLYITTPNVLPALYS